MRYLIDGHNLIPKAGLRLDSMDDELQLVNMLKEFARLSRQTVEVYFDGAPVGQAGTRNLGTVTAHFVKAGQSADAAIRARLEKMGKEAKNWVVVSSDHAVQSAARVHRAGYLSCEEFVKEMRKAARVNFGKEKDEPTLSTSEVEEWLREFSKGKADK